VADDSTPAGVPTHRDVIQSLAAAFQSNRDPQQALAARTAAVDELVARAAAEHVAAAGESRFTIAACGGYGRRELFPYSDIDLLILVPHESDIGALKTVFSDLPQALWDAGLRVGHSVRTVADCVQLNEQNVELHISLLDLRYLAGDRSLLDELTTKLHDFYHRHAHLLMQRLAELSRARHAKYNDTVFHLEPNIKETPGGLRDWHLLHWLGLLMPQNEAIRESALALRSPVEFLSRLRCFLHFQTNRDSNLLTFDLQDSAAQELADGPLLPGQWMRLYFKGARQISQSALRALEYAETQDTSLVQQFRDWRARLSTTEFTVSREQIFLRKPTETTASGEGVLALFAFVSRHGIRLSWDAQRRLRADAALIEQRVATRAPKWPLWKELFGQPHVALALREMEETGALNALIPEWNAIDSLVVRDFYHRYTVDEHTFVAIEAIDDLARTKPSPPQISKLRKRPPMPASIPCLARHCSRTQRISMALKRPSPRRLKSIRTVSALGSSWVKCKPRMGKRRKLLPLTRRQSKIIRAKLTSTSSWENCMNPSRTGATLVTLIRKHSVSNRRTL